uniref:CUB domain-containing protein n=1 Tax=Stomoxys calcitrans TaxID=35570 RepID=A0A1I8NRK2_STOCA
MSTLTLVLGLLMSGVLQTVYSQTSLQCNANSKLKRIVIKNPANINQDNCVYHILPHSSNVCQLLIEFQQFELEPPTYRADVHTLECEDHLAVGDFHLCGHNTGQHLYLPFNVAKGTKEIALAFSLANRWPQSKWNLVVTQLECSKANKRMSFSSLWNMGDNMGLQNMRTLFTAPTFAKTICPKVNEDILAPAGCNQYYTQPTGTIRSFNYQENAASYYLPNMNYVVCIKAGPDATMIEYQASKFSMSLELPSLPGYDGDCHSYIQTDGRREDYLMIPQSHVANSVNIVPTYYCGTSLQTRPSLIASAPFIMYFSSDSFTDETETGFSINYRIRTA